LVYGYPGAIMPVYDELYKFKRWIAACFSTTNKATHAAQGYARATEK
jgi:thiamine pyrophosphate-dependent acetolactate synthase large subunit-like protein